MPKSPKSEARKYLVQQIIKSLETNPYAVEKAILLIGGAQTDEEQALGTTIEANDVGFAASDARLGTWCYDQIVSARRRGVKPGYAFDAKGLCLARKVAFKYVNTQLFEAAWVKLHTVTHNPEDFRD